MSRAKSLVMVAVWVWPVFAQTGPYPGGGYPQGRYPQTGPSLPLPWPRKGKNKKGEQTDKSAPLTRNTGALRKIDDKSILIEVPDGRELNFQRTAKTLFYGTDSKEMQPSKLKAGDEVAVESTQDDKGYLSAEKVYLEKAGAETGAGKPDEGAAAKKDSQSEETKPGSESETEMRQPPSSTPADPDDPGPPSLRRGVPPKRAESRPAAEAPVTVARVDSPDGSVAPAKVPAASVPPARAEAYESKVDPVIEKARGTAGAFSESLPDYVCQEFMARSVSGARPSDWQALDIVSTEVVYRGGHESYRNIAINGKPAHKEMEQLDGSWSTGEFASELLDLFAPSTAAEFHFRSESRASGMAARVYDFEVSQPRSHWHVQMASQSINPAYKGSIWIEPRSGHVLRIEMQARGLPEEFPLVSVESAVDYADIRIGEGQFFLPVHAENLGCQRSSRSCSKNTIDFRNYHKYEANSNITFDNEAK